MSDQKRYELHPLMVRSGIFFLLCSFILAVLIPFNDSVILGINAYVKPLKFALSISIYCFTFAWILPMIRDHVLVRRFSYFAVFTMLFEQTVITFQAGRGVQSHFNHSTSFDDILYGLMGIFIFSITIYTAFLTFRLQRQTDDIHPAVKSALVWGLSIFVGGSLIGGVMSGIDSHVVGGAMGEEGLPFTNWSRQYGDLRIAHFAGLHSLQIIPFVGFLCSRMLHSTSKQVFIVSLVSFIYILLVIVLLLKALAGIPLPL